MLIKLILQFIIIIPNISCAADLLDVWRASQSRDHAFIMSQLEQAAGKYRNQQGTSLWLPNVYLAATAGRIGSNNITKGATFAAPGMASIDKQATFETNITHGLINKNTLSIIQPIYDLQRLAETKQLKQSAVIGNLTLDVAQHNLMLLVADRYFSVLLANEHLFLMNSYSTALHKTYEEIKKRFQLGDATKIDLQEAAESIENIKVKLIEAKSDLIVKKLALADLLGTAEDIKKLKKFFIPTNIVNKNLTSLEQCIIKMTAQNLQLKILKALQEVARQEVAKYHALGSIKLNAVAQVSHVKNKGRYNASNNMKDYVLGIELSAPIFTGFYRTAKENETLQLLEKSKEEYNKAALEIEHNIRNCWFALSFATQKIKALENNLSTSKKKLLLTIKGHAVGSRNTLEILRANSDTIEIENTLFKEKIACLLNYLNMKAMTGELTEQDLLLVNQYLE